MRTFRRACRRGPAGLLCVGRMVLQQPATGRDPPTFAFAPRHSIMRSMIRATSILLLWSMLPNVAVPSSIVASFIASMQKESASEPGGDQRGATRDGQTPGDGKTKPRRANPSPGYVAIRPPVGESIERCSRILDHGRPSARSLSASATLSIGHTTMAARLDRLVSESRCQCLVLAVTAPSLRSNAPPGQR